MRETLPAEDQALLTELRAFLGHVAPEINAHWIRAEFPTIWFLRSPASASSALVRATASRLAGPGRLHRAGTGARRLLDRHLRRGPRRAFQPARSTFVARTSKGALAAGDGADGEAGLVRPVSPRSFGRRGRTDDHLRRRR
jgi:hypothetical protein